MNDLWIHPGLILLLGALVLPLVPEVLRKPFYLLVPLLCFARTLQLEHGTFGTLQYLDWTLVFGRVDGLSYVFGFIMALMSVLGTLYCLHTRQRGEIAAAWVYAGSAIGAIYAGDFLTLFLFWEIMAFSSVFLVWLRGRRQSLASGYRYLLVHTLGGVLLLAGLLLHCKAPGNTWAFELMDVAHPTPAMYLILCGFLLNAAVPPLHAWLPDAYGEASVGGAVFLCAFTTKTAVYALARGFAGMEILIPLGVIMALYGVVYAVLENDSRRLLAYHIISQVGYMVAGVGIGTALAINGVCAHAFAHILYKGLLFMGCGAVLHMTGQSKFTELGGLYRKMPWTFLLTLIGGLSISAFPLFSGFVSKSIIVSASFDEHQLWAAYLLLLASAGTFLHTGLKVPYFIWFGKNNCKPETWARAQDPCWNMIAAMTLTAGLCIGIGSWTPFLYDLLPNRMDYAPYTAYHISETLLILLFTALGFFLLIRKLEPTDAISLDMDSLYRKAARSLLCVAQGPVQALDNLVGKGYRYLGLLPLGVAARMASAIDRLGIDHTVDSVATGVGELGTRLRVLQRGRVQETLVLTLAILVFVLLLPLLYFALT